MFGLSGIVGVFIVGSVVLLLAALLIALCVSVNALAGDEIGALKVHL